MNTVNNAQDEELLTALPDGYMDTFDYLFQKSTEKDIEIPVSVPIMALMVLADDSKAEVIQGLRPYAVDTALRAVIAVLDLVRKVEPESLTHKAKGGANEQ